MSRAPEQKIYDKLARELSKLLPKGRWRMQRIETSTAVGVPDVYFRSGHRVCWIETKDDAYVLSKEQYAWSHREVLAGGRVWLYNGMFMEIDVRMLDYSSLGQYRKAVEHLELSTEAWLWRLLENN